MGGIEAIFKKHNDWVDIVQTFGCNKETAEDLVQEMYLKIVIFNLSNLIKNILKKVMF